MSNRLSYYPNLYVGESIPLQKLDKLKRKLERTPILSSLYVIALCRNPDDQLEIYEARQLAQSYYRKHPPYIIGLAGDYDEAVLMIKRSVEECMEKRGDCALKEYLQC